MIGKILKTRSMTSFSQWDFILLPFPFTDFQTTKKRPALVVSPDEYNEGEDIIITFVTSQLDRTPRPGDYYLEDWQKAKLPKPSMIRMKFATISNSIVEKKLGRMSQKDIKKFKIQFISFFINT